MDSLHSASQDHFIQQLRQNLGLITERIAPLATSSTSWKIIQKIDLRPYFEAGEQLVDRVEAVVRACGPSCEADGLLEEAQTSARQADRVLDLIVTHGDAVQPHRVRRALLPFIGSIHKFLYGTLTEADEVEIQTAIRAIAEDTRATVALLANQTEIVERELSDMSRRMLKLKVSSDMLINRTAENSNRLVSQNAVQNAKASIAQFKLDTEVITDAILFAVQGLVHPRILPPSAIGNSAKLVGNAISFAKFPLDPSEFSAIPIMRISEITLLFSDGHLIYHIAIPLLDIERFALFKASPIPAIQQVLNVSDVVAYVWPEHRYFAVSSTNRTYMPIPAEKVPNLRKLMDTLIAINPEPVREIKNNAACEIKIAAGREIADPNTCDIRVRQLRDTFWLRLSKANAWVFSAKSPEDIFIQCVRAEQITTQISGAGVLQLREGCTAHTSNARLMASQSLTDRLNTSTFGSLEFDVAKILARLNGTANTEADLRQAIVSETAYRAESLHGTDLENLGAGAGLRAIADKAREISRRKASAFELKNLSDYASIFGYSSWSLIGALAIAIILVWCLLRYRAGQPMGDLIK